MFYWFLYIIFSVVFAFFLTSFFSKKLTPFFLFLLITLLVTPANIHVSSEELAPAIFIFFFDVLLENNISFRSLRPLILTVPMFLFLFWIITIIKKRFF